MPFYTNTLRQKNRFFLLSEPSPDTAQAHHRLRFFIEFPRSLPASSETSVTGAGGTCPGAEKPRRANSPTPVNTEKRFPGSHRRLSSEAVRQKKLFCRETEDTGIKTENVPDS